VIPSFKLQIERGNINVEMVGAKGRICSRAFPFVSLRVDSWEEKTAGREAGEAGVARHSRPDNVLDVTATSSTTAPPKSGGITPQFISSLGEE
jgi:hypothetical protein